MLINFGYFLLIDVRTQSTMRQIQTLQRITKNNALRLAESQRTQYYAVTRFPIRHDNVTQSNIHQCELCEAHNNSSLDTLSPALQSPGTNCTLIPIKQRLKWGVAGRPSSTCSGLDLPYCNLSSTCPKKTVMFRDSKPMTGEECVQTKISDVWSPKIHKN